MAYRNWLVISLDFVREVFEHASPSIFSLMATLLPYLSPLPVAIMTAANATTYLNFTPNTAAIFVFVLECLGLWVTTVLVDTIVDAIRSRNAKAFIMVVILSLVVAAYVYILINLNVSLETADPTKDVSPAYSRIITLICFLPLISGFMNGYWKIQIENKLKAKTNDVNQIEREDKLRRENAEREDKLRQEKMDYEAKQEEAERQFQLNKLKLKNEAKVNNPPKVEKEITKSASASNIGSSKHWRNFEDELTPAELLRLSNLTSNEIKDLAIEKDVTEVTVRNWKINAKRKLHFIELEQFIQDSHRFPNADDVSRLNIPSIDVALFVVRHKKSLLGRDLLTEKEVTIANEMIKAKKEKA